VDSLGTELAKVRNTTLLRLWGVRCSEASRHERQQSASAARKKVGERRKKKSKKRGSRNMATVGVMVVVTMTADAAGVPMAGAIAVVQTARDAAADERGFTEDTSRPRRMAGG
tara:strand:- start:29770 stop:30108 length:339 start_codon:yes stop_codon:yes gene_type:complete